MQEVRIKTHLIITGMHEEYFVDWCGKIANTKPLLKNGLPIFVIIGSEARMELNTIDIKRIEENAKRMTHPHGRQAVTTDIAHIYIKEENGSETLMGRVIHNHVKEYRQMYDSFQKI